MKQNNSNNIVDKKEKYAISWNKDAMKMNSNELYSWMSSHIKNYKNILEIGCGSGISTLNLLKTGHNVIIVEFNEIFIDMTKKLLNDNKYYDINIIKYQISESNCINIGNIIKNKIDLIICWNPGGVASLTNEEILCKMIELEKLEYPSANILNDFESHYAEDLIRSALSLAKNLNVDAHIIDRYKSTENTTNFLEELKNTYEFREVITDEISSYANENTMKTNETIIFKSFLFKR